MENTNDEIVKPVSNKERIKELDIIRGFALFGVLLVNIAMFNTTLFSTFAGKAPLSNPLELNTLMDRWAGIFIHIFAEGKFYTIFSFLFGLGFFIFMERAEKKKASPRVLFVRRSLSLLLFGILHFALVWYGDILHVYGIIGLFLLLFKNSSLKTIKIWIIILLVLSTFIFAAFVFLDALVKTLDPHFMAEQSSNSLILMAESVKMHQEGSFIDIITYRLSKEAVSILSNFVFLIPKILGMFLIGLYVGKKGILENIKRNLPYINKVWGLTGIIGVLATIVYVCLKYQFPNLTPLLVQPMIKVFEEVATVFLSMFYVTSLILLLHKSPVSKLLNPLRYMGQMALTNYLVQCIICSFIFYGYGLALLNKIGLAPGILITILIYGLQIFLSKKWLERFKYGPFEWVWRRLTYGGSI